MCHVAFNTHPNSNGLYTGTGSSTCPKCPGHAAATSPHVAQGAGPDVGPIAGSYSPSGTGCPMLSNVMGDVMRLTLSLRTCCGGGRDGDRSARAGGGVS